MSDTEARYEVLEEFTQGLLVWESPGERQYRMADEIVRLRQRADRAERILAALRKPSEAVIDATSTALYYSNYTDYAIRTAVAAAEREVNV